MCLRSWSCWKIQPCLILRPLTDGKRVIAQNLTIHHLLHISHHCWQAAPKKDVSTPMLHCWYRIFGMQLCILPPLTQRVALIPKSSMLVASDHDILPVLLWAIQIVSGKLYCYCGTSSDYVVLGCFITVSDHLYHNMWDLAWSHRWREIVRDFVFLPFSINCYNSRSLLIKLLASCRLTHSNLVHNLWCPWTAPWSWP